MKLKNLMIALAGFAALSPAFSFAEEPLIQQRLPDESPNSVQIGVPPYYYIPVVPVHRSGHHLEEYPQTKALIPLNPTGQRPGFWTNHPARRPSFSNSPSNILIPGQIRIEVR